MSKKATIIAVVNQKGGTGKTTTTENLGVGLALEGKKVLLVDTDPQASLTVSLGNPCPDDLSPTLSAVALPNQIADVFGVVGAAVHHRQKNPFNPQFRVDLPLDLVDGYEIVSGHRRHRASELAGKETMPAIVRDLDDDAGVRTPKSRTLSAVFIISSSSTTRKGCPSKGCSSESGISCTRSCWASALE